MADASPDIEQLRALLAEYDRATGEIAWLSRTGDLGSGERTARLSSLGAWEMHQSRIAQQIAAIAGDADLDRVRARLEE
ncbi:MAG: hypothetical protein WC273_07985 [Dehalococcoidia bacterium]